VGFPAVYVQDLVGGTNVEGSDRPAQTRWGGSEETMERNSKVGEWGSLAHGCPFCLSLSLSLCLSVSVSVSVYTYERGRERGMK
jgi:hypothetical protein